MSDMTPLAYVGVVEAASGIRAAPDVLHRE